LFSFSYAEPRRSSAFIREIGGRFFTSELRNQNSEVTTDRKSFACFLVRVSAFVCFLSGTVTRKPFVCFLGGQKIAHGWPEHKRKIR
jgi:hypothetical protein